MIDSIRSQFKANSEKTVNVFVSKLATFRTGHATSGLIEQLMVDAYGSKMPLKSVASITVPDPKLLIVQPWDKANMQAIEKAILTSNLGLTPQVDNQIIRVIVPPLTGERREEFKKLVKQETEKARVTVRSFRKEAIDQLKKEKETKELSEDEEERGKELLQKDVDDVIARLDDLLAKKIADLDQI